jgi:hypothetical protein
MRLGYCFSAYPQRLSYYFSAFYNQSTLKADWAWMPDCQKYDDAIPGSGLTRRRLPGQETDGPHQGKPPSAFREICSSVRSPANIDQ